MTHTFSKCYGFHCNKKVIFINLFWHAKKIGDIMAVKLQFWKKKDFEGLHLVSCANY